MDEFTEEVRDPDTLLTYTWDRRERKDIVLRTACIGKWTEVEVEVPTPASEK
jgi:hypothetical protein